MLTPSEIRSNRTYKEMGLRDSEYQLIVGILGRDPNYTELGMFAVLWSEHCAYKHTRPLFRHFPTEGPRILQGPGENAGVVSIGDGLAVVFKVESHNHPSAVEPYQGAATGVGGIIRDIFTMGARPIACLNSLRFGPLTDPRVRYLFGGVVSGIAGYGNCVGVPTVGGEVYFDPSYSGNPLVNVMAVGLVEERFIARAAAKGVGNPVMVVGAATGRDGIHGASFASAELNEESESKRPSVQVGDPFTEKLLIEACLELIQSGVVIGIQDMGAAGLTSSACEMASRAGSGIEMDLALVPLREEGMTSYEIMLSESQERMLVVPKLGEEERVKQIFEKWGLHAVVVGRVTDDGILRILEDGKIAAEVPAWALSTDGAPSYVPEARRPEHLDELHQLELAQISVPADPGEVLLRLLASPSLASKEWVYRQYDYQVQTNTVAGPGSDAAVLRVKGTNKGLAVTIDGNARYGFLDAGVGARIAVAEAARNLACAGATPIGCTDGLNFGNPEKPEIYWQIREAVLGISDACRALDIPVTGGNASLYNETNGEAIYPTPVIGMVGLLEDISHRCPSGFVAPGDTIVLLGETRDELGGSEYLALEHGLVAGHPPQVDLQREKALIQTLLAGIQRAYIKSAHDCAEGGLAVALAESCLAGGLGAGVLLQGELRLDSLLFGESQGRAVVTVASENLAALCKLASEAGLPATVIGAVRGEPQLVVRVLKHGLAPVLSVPLQEMLDSWGGAIERAMA